MSLPDASRTLVDLGGRVVCARVRRPDAGPATGPPVVLLAGGAGQGTDGEWGPYLEDRLLRGHVVVTYDRAGGGRSDGPPHGTVAGMAEELEQVLRAVVPGEPVVLVGWSLGGHVAQGYALRYPEHVAGLVFVDPTPIEPPPDVAAVRVQLVVTPPLTAALAAASWLGVFSGRLGERVASLLSSTLAGEDMTPETTRLLLRFLRTPSALTGQVALMRLVPRYSAELTEALSEAATPDVPAVVITAGRRAGVPEAYAEDIRASHERLAARFPRSRCVVADRASHQVPFDDPDVIVTAVGELSG